MHIELKWWVPIWILGIACAYAGYMGSWLVSGIVAGALISVLILAATDPSGQLRSRLDRQERDLTETKRSLLQEVSNRKVAEKHLSVKDAALRHAQKMEDFGRVAGGVAHDFNNLLTPILGFTELALAKTSQESDVQDDLQEVLRSANRASDLARQLLAFSRKQVLQPRVVDLNQIITSMERMLRSVLGETISLSIVAEDGSVRVKADPGQIEQVIMNLAVNAKDAMPSGGRLTIETHSPQSDESGVLVDPELLKSYVRLSVIDTGSGMASSTLSRLFEPFFTTKERGKGTGLGLSMVYGIVKQSGGHVKVRSRLGEGSAFSVYLPRCDEEIEEPASERPLSKRIVGAWGVLVVEDEVVVRKLVTTVLRSQGFEVFEAGNGEEAIAAFARARHQVHLVITDMVMPGMGGRELAKLLSKDRPDLKLLFMSGYAESGILKQGILGADYQFLSKPFTPDALIRKVRDILAAQADEAVRRGLNQKAS